MPRRLSVTESETQSNPNANEDTATYTTKPNEGEVRAQRFSPCDMPEPMDASPGRAKSPLVGEAPGDHGLGGEDLNSSATQE